MRNHAPLETGTTRLEAMMDAIRIMHEDDIPWVAGRHTVKEGKRLEVHNKAPILHVDDGPWLGRARYDPGMVVPLHAHPTNEIIYVIGGDVTIGGKTYGPGTVIGIKAGT